MEMVDVHGCRVRSRSRRDKRPGRGDILLRASCCTEGSLARVHPHPPTEQSTTGVTQTFGRRLILWNVNKGKIARGPMSSLPMDLEGRSSNHCPTGQQSQAQHHCAIDDPQELLLEAEAYLR